MDDFEMFLEAFGDILEIHDELSTSPNEKNIAEFKKSFESIKTIVKGLTRAYTEGCVPGKNGGSIYLEGKRLETNEPGMLADIINKSSVGEICPKTNGNIFIDITFRNLYTMEGAGEDE